MVWQVRASTGGATYVPEKEALVWKIKNFPGGKEFLLRASFTLPSVQAEEELQRRPPIQVRSDTKCNDKHLSPAAKAAAMAATTLTR
jgi:hypothetical protein